MDGHPPGSGSVTESRLQADSPSHRPLMRGYVPPELQLVEDVWHGFEKSGAPVQHARRCQEP